MLFVQEGSDTEIFGIEIDVDSCDIEGVIADEDLFSDQGALGFENGSMEGNPFRRAIFSTTNPIIDGARRAGQDKRGCPAESGQPLCFSVQVEVLLRRDDSKPHHDPKHYENRLVGLKRVV